MITGMPRIAIAASDFGALIALFRDTFDMPTIDLSASGREEYGIALGLCVPEGGSHIELMSPLDPDTPLSGSLQRFIERRGEGLFALMLDAPVPDEEAGRLAARGLRVLPLMPGAHGRDIHPASTHGVLIRVYPDGFLAGLAPAVRRRHAPPLSGIVRAIVAVDDVDDAARVFREGFELPVTPVAADARRGVRVARCRPPKGGEIEMVAVHDAARPFAAALQAHLRRQGEGLYALVLRSPDLPGSAAWLRAKGLGAAPAIDDPAVLEVPRDAAFGALIRIEAA